MSDTKVTNSNEMPFVQHLLELRDRLVRSIIAVIIFFAMLFPFANEIYEFVALPILTVLPEDAGLIAIGIISPFLTPLKMSLIFAIYLAMPFLLHQIWGYIAPALYKHEKRMAVPLLISSTLLFYCGLAFSYFVVMPVVFGFLTSIGPTVVTVTPDIQFYLDFVLKMSFAFGVAFEVPIATILLLMTGATTVEKLSKQRPFIVVFAFIIGMLLTPPDIISQILIALPMWFLFEIGLLVYRYLIPKNKSEIDINEEMTDKEMDEEFDNIDKAFKKINTKD
jgi:sec-independent protein translocase protein TatC